ncbi:phospholipid N-methyltransferase [Histomonas meleagridis]|uniref:phospholipid N-methyltransferase n=1 Tax=Histomonas meleagridis TaxID=135588 RepID=UPI00355A5B66|nr:phospholipid N-methyltransferase [Histomonas meleagridis]KAH0802422.1 phospholipid N-methyltransferase [Histomonas meleagridis]
MKTICMVLYAAYGFQGKFTFKYIYISIVCIAIGQYLNYIVYTRLGKVRAYYGWELGIDNSPPIHGFPFDIGHPQYKGCFLTLLGTYLLFEATKKFTFFTIIWTIMYFYITLIESTSPGRKA